ncbi:hypothetical protein BC941DRAFT_511001 [Chlamydoabsidia padenii]|nr:hypothetical protein BC941DRAFT_511001 [Chlamydoabsidia padenii]
MKSPTLQFNMMCISSYSDDEEEDDGSMSTGRTMSSISIPPLTLENSIHSFSTLSSDNSSIRSSSSLSMSFFQHAMESELQSSVVKNTYFMDGGNRFISVPMLGNTNAKDGSNISRFFEEWLANKLYCHPESDYTMSNNDTMMMEEDQEYGIVVDQLLPILQDHVELVAEDIMNKMKSSTSSWQRKGLDKVMIKVRMGHVYTYHSLKDGQPLITQDMEELFQQFPLFVECLVYTSSLPSHQSNNTTSLLLVVENVTINPGNPYKIMEEF